MPGPTSDSPPTGSPPLAGLPAQRPAVERTGADVLRSLGLDAVVDLVEGLSAPVGVLDGDSRWSYLNPAACRLLGRSFDQLHGTAAEAGTGGRSARTGGEELVLVELARAASDRPKEQAEVARSAAERERLRLGRDLHDSVSSALFALHTRTQVVDRALAAGDLALLAEAAKDMQALSGQAIAELRAMVSAIRDDPAAGNPAGGGHDLPEALERLAATTRSRHGLEVRLDLDRPLPEVPASTAEHLARIAGEAVHNVVKHAAADEVRVELGVRGSELVLTVVDEGRGFDPSAARRGGHGQSTMRERAVLCGGWLHVDAAPGRGTRVVTRVPLPG